MKSLLSLLILTVSLFTLTVPAFAQTNTPSSLDTVKSAVATNMNQVLIEMLSGTKDAAKEIYGASKEAIHKSVDFVSEQAPDIIKQFLMWKFCEAALYALAWLVFGAFLVYVAKYLHKIYQDIKDNDWSYDPLPGFTWFGRMAAIIGCVAILIFGVGGEVKEMVKIKVAPKVYIIEYVVDTVKSYEHSQNNNHRHNDNR